MTSPRQHVDKPIDDPRLGFSRWGVAPPTQLDRIVHRYPFRISDHLMRRIVSGQPRDPLALQCMPGSGELMDVPQNDPTGDTRCRPVPRLVRKHPNRVVLLVTSACLMNCRFCFRKASPFSDDDQGLEPAFHYLEADSRIQEVILSGGDPLAISDRRLDLILARLRAIPHLRLLRIHTRALTAQPARITPSLVHLLRRYRPLYLVLHTNHPAELDAQAREAIARLLEAGIPLLNQSVLLRGINDNARTLADLSWQLLELQVTPYYLHHCDRVPGTAAFWTSLETGRRIHAELATLVPGHGLPWYVIDLPGGAGKVPVMAGRRVARDRWQFPLPGGDVVTYFEQPLPPPPV